MTRREWLALAAASGFRAPAAAAGKAPTVAISRCRSYDDAELSPALSTLFDRIGVAGIVRNKTVAIKLNLTGSPGLKFQGRPLGATHYSHPKMAGTVAVLLARAGARRIRFLESCWASAGPLEEYLLDAGWNVRALQNAAPVIEFENTNALGKGRRYSRLKVPGGGLIFPAYELNHSYEDTDVFVSMAKLKNHATCGVTLSMKNCFGMTPASIYGDDAKRDQPNESPGKGRVDTCHMGKRQPASPAPAEKDPSSSRDPGYRMPRITAELITARPVDLAIVDGIQTIAGGEGPWVRGIRTVEPGLLIAGTNAVATDAVSTAAMGYDPRAPRGQAPFRECDNTLLLAESLGAGTCDLNRIDVRGLPLADAVYRFG